MNSRNITDTNARVFKALSGVAQQVYDNQNVETKIDKAVSENMITSAYITKFYPYLNKCEVKLDSNGKLVLCSLLSLCSGDLISMYTPNGDESFCEKLNEPCIIPRGKLPVLVANINSDEYDYVMLGYFFPDDLVGFNPSAPAQFKISAFGAVKEYSLKFGLDGLKIVTNGEVELTARDDFEEDKVLEYYDKTVLDDKFTVIDDKTAIIDSEIEELEEKVVPSKLVDLIYPVGSIYMSVNDTDPSVLFGGVWDKIKDTFLLGSGDTYELGDSDGEASVTLTANQSGIRAHGHGMAHNHNHRHQFSRRDVYTSGGSASGAYGASSSATQTYYTGYDNTASSKTTTDNNTAQNASEAHNNMPPYLVVNIWKRRE